MKNFFQKYNLNSVLWISWRFLLKRKGFFQGSEWISFLGLVLGVAGLVVSMAVFSGFESTLKGVVTDVMGHVQVVHQGSSKGSWESLAERIRKIRSDVVGTTPFVLVEALTGGQNQISGILLQGVDSQSFRDVINYQGRVVSGNAERFASSSEGEDLPLAFIGKRLAEKLGVSVGDSLRVIIPIVNSGESEGFRRQQGQLRIAAILDFGKFDWNERFVVMDLKNLQSMAQIGDRYSGLFLKFKSPEEGRLAAKVLSDRLGSGFWLRDWRESNENLFDAVVYEKAIVFFVVFIIVCVAALNISSSLFVKVMKRFVDIGILKTLGLRPSEVVGVFALHGFFIGVGGFLSGAFLGFLFTKIFMLLQIYYGVTPGSVYKVERIVAEIRLLDLIFIFFATILVCLLATLAPALRGARLNPVEGLRHG